MDEFAVADIDADVAEGTAHGVEEHQIAGLQFVFVNFLSGRSLLRRLAWQQQSGSLLVDGAHKAAAIKTDVGLGAAAFVGHTQKRHRVHHQFGSAVTNFVADITNPGQQAALRQQAGHVIAGGGGLLGVGDAQSEHQGTGKEKTHRRTLVGEGQCVKRSDTFDFTSNALIRLDILCGTG